MGAANYSLWIHARPEDVWRIYVDPSRIPDWQTGSPVIEDISGAGDEPGTTYVSRRGPGTAQTTVLEAVRPRQLVTRTEAYLGLQLELISELTSEGEGTLLERRARTEWPRGRALLGKLIEVVILNPSEARKELARLKTLVERGMKAALTGSGYVRWCNSLVVDDPERRPRRAAGGGPADWEIRSGGASEALDAQRVGVT